MSTHNVCFGGELRKIFTGYTPLSRPVSTDNICFCGKYYVDTRIVKEAYLMMILGYFFLQFSIKTYVVSIHYKRLAGPNSFLLE